MKTVIVRLVLWAVVSLVLVVVAAGITVAQQEPSGDPKADQVDRADVDIALQPDASLIVTERLTFAYDGTFSASYRDIPLQDGVQISDVSVSDRLEGDYSDGGSTAYGSTDRAGRFGTEPLPRGGVRVVWHYRQQDGERTFQVRYRVNGAAIAYDDALVVPWAPWGSQWQFWLNHLTATFRVAQPPTREPLVLREWELSSVPSTSVVSTADSRTFEYDRTKPDSQVGLTVAFKPDAVSSTGGAVRGEGSGLESTDDKNRARDERAALMGLADTVWMAHVPLLLIATLLTGLATFVLYRRGREYDHGVPEHLPGPPAPESPAVAFALANEGGYDERVVLATLLDLVDRGYYKADPTEGKDLDLRLSVVDDRPSGPSARYEVEVMGFFDGLLAKGGPCELGKLADRIPKHDSSWRKRWEAMNAALGEAGDDQISWDRDLRPYRAMLALAIVGVHAIVLWLLIMRTGYFGAPVAGLISSLLLLFLFPSTWLQRRDHASIQLGAQWAAFAKWTKDFPRLDDDPPATLALWRRVLVYAVAFGTAERVIESGKIPAPLAEQDDGWSRGMMHGYSYGALSGSSFGSGFSSQVAPQSSSSSGGGGGGFSGGGGGGSW